MTEGRIPPFSLESEQATLGAIMIDPDGVAKLEIGLSGEDFYEPRHRIIFDSIESLYESSRPVDLLTVAEELKTKDKLDAAGGMGYLMDLTTATPTSANLNYYAGIVAQKSILRNIIRVGEEIASLGYMTDLEASAALDEAEKKIYHISLKKRTAGFSPLGKLLGPVLKQLEEIHEKGTGITGLRSGYYDLDKLTAGFQKSDLIILAARPSVGKSSLGINMACHVAIKEKIPVAVFSLEMSKESLAQRMISSEARVNAQDMRRGSLSDEAWTRMGDVMGELYKAPIYIDDSADLSVLELRAKARKLAMDKGLGLIIIDYLQLLHTKGKSENRVQEVSQITRSLKGLARELSVPVIVQSQLSRSIEQRQDNRPVLSDLRESGSIEQDADVVLFLSRPASEKERAMGLMDLILAKQRNGPVGNIKLKFISRYTRFENLLSGDDQPDMD
ncbi:MAG TPA: replicative DNA helicase [Caldisericia bacterium]|nr:replicative DNA helicase [Caldisericia bacterium]HPF49598.1 replicative DNA helicase [Caldisericia bacterium]HPI84486.1 replicative DNA helicase [Caldisericia bacterium]HPQ93852.1 replicative DNA helicase [Caldisericia bacterium]HRV75397.1 replicative DNA helicase [Caldisericia bacterium]